MSLVDEILVIPFLLLLGFLAALIIFFGSFFSKQSRNEKIIQNGVRDMVVASAKMSILRHLFELVIIKKIIDVIHSREGSFFSSKVKDADLISSLFDRLSTSKYYSWIQNDQFKKLRSRGSFIPVRKMNLIPSQTSILCFVQLFSGS
jgi:hypothetical protein